MLQFTGERFIPTKELINDEIGFEHLHRYHAIIPFIQNKTVLDIACGEGYGTALIGKYAQKVVGVDIDESCIKWAIEHYGPTNNKLSFKVGSVERIPLENNTVDVVISFETIEHVDKEHQRLFMLEIKRVLKPDGLLIISTPNTGIYTEKSDHHNQFHVKELEKEEFREFLKEHFTHIYHFYQGYEIVSAITSPDIDNIKQLQVYNWDRDQKAVNRKYLIAIVANQEIPNYEALSSAVLQVDKDFLELAEHIKSLQKKEALLQRENLLQMQSAAIEQTTEKITEKEQQLQTLTEEKEQQIKDISEKENLIHSISIEKEKQAQIIHQVSASLVDKENVISELNHKISTLYQQVDQLNNRLSDIYSSEGWKLLSVYYRLKGKFLPEHSSRYKILKKIINKLRNKKTVNYAITNFMPPPQFVSEEVKVFDFIEFPIFDQPKVSIIIPAYNGWQMNYKCLRSIFKNTYGTSYEVIFADDVSTDETVNIKSYIKNITVVRNENNLGFLKNCNHAATFAKGDYIHFLNNDTEVRPGWLSSLTELMDKNPEIGMAGSKLIYPDGRLQEAGGIFWQDASAWNFGHKQNPEAPEFNYLKEVDYISGASLMVRKSAWLKVGGFDELFLPAYCEDSDLAFEIRKLNLKVVYQPLSVVVHHEGFSHGSDEKPKAGLTSIKSYQKINIIKFSEKWKEVLNSHFPNAVNVFWARDRSQFKKTIVVVDHYVPEFDKDAGSRTTFQYLQLFVELGLNVKFITDNFYKHEPYTTILQQMGIEVLYGSHFADTWQKWIAENEKYFDFIFLNRPHVATKYIDFVRNNTHAKIYYYGHDLHFQRELKEYEITNDENKRVSSANWKKIEYNIFNKSDIILTPTLKEKNIIADDFTNKTIKVMPAFFYPTIAEPIKNFDQRQNILFVGGFSHSPNVDAVLWFVERIFPVIHEQRPTIQLIIVGSNVPDKILNLTSSNIIIKGFVSDSELEQLYQSVQMSIIPLRFGAGLKGKTVEAMVKGLPIVSTSFGLEGLIDIEPILQPQDSEQEFADAILELYDNPVVLEKLSASIVQYAGKHFTKESAKVFFKSLFDV